jgi:hypothetical protein
MNRWLGDRVFVVGELGSYRRPAHALGYAGKCDPPFSVPLAVSHYVKVMPNGMDMSNGISAGRELLPQYAYATRYWK